MPIRLAHKNPGMGPGACVEPFVGRCRHSDPDAEHAVECCRRPESPIEAEGEFVEVRL